MSQEMLSRHPCGLILDPHCQFVSARIKLLFSVITFTTESTYHCTFLSPPPFLSFFFFFHRSLGLQSTFLSPSPNKTKTKKQKTRACGQSDNPLIYTVSIASQTDRSASKAGGQAGKGSDTQCLSVT